MNCQLSSHYRTVHVRAEANPAAAVTADQSGALLHAVLWRRLRAVSDIPLHHLAARTDAVWLPRTNVRPDLPRDVHALRSLLHWFSDYRSYCTRTLIYYCVYYSRRRLLSRK